MRAAALNSRRSSTGGFTLVEVIVSMFLMAVVFTAAFGAYFLGMRIIEDAREEVRAAQIIQSELERLRTKNWLQLGLLPTNATFEPQGNFVKQYAMDYQATRRLVLYNSGRQMLVIVRVSWTSGQGRQRMQSFTTVITRDGLNDYYYRDI